MEEYPRNVMDLEKQFSTEDACKDYLFRLRWRTDLFVHSKSRGKLFYRLLQQAVQVDPVTYAQMIGGKSTKIPHLNWRQLDTQIL